MIKMVWNKVSLKFGFVFSSPFSRSEYRVTGFSFWVVMLLLSSCDTVRILGWNKANVDDYKKFPYAIVGRDSSAVPSSLLTLHNHSLLRMPVAMNGDTSSLDAFLMARQTTAWLVSRSDTLVSEYYAPGWDSSSLLTSFSIAKSFVGTLVGIALTEGAIRSVDQPVTDFLPWLIHPEMNRVTLRHLLNMRAALDFDEGYSSLFSPMPKLYYGRNTRAQVEKSSLKGVPGFEYEYQSLCTQLLSMSLESATGSSVSDYLETRLWHPLGMESDAIWSRASNSDSTVKSFCCLNMVGRDYIRFGLLWMNRGMWNGRRVIPEVWVAETLSDTLNSKDSRGYSYSHQWRIMPDGAMFAKGVLGQYLWINPSLRLVIARFGKTEADTDWVKVFRQVEESFVFEGSKNSL